MFLQEFHNWELLSVVAFLVFFIPIPGGSVLGFSFHSLESKRRRDKSDTVSNVLEGLVYRIISLFSKEANR